MHVYNLTFLVLVATDQAGSAGVEGVLQEVRREGGSVKSTALRCLLHFDLSELLNCWRVRT